MILDDPVITTCAICGAPAGRHQRPAIAHTVQEHAAGARRIVQDTGRRPATVAQAREMPAP